MYASVHWKGGLSFTAAARSGFEVDLGASKGVGGDEDGFRPLEMIGIGLAGCTGMDVISILKKKRQDVRAFDVVVEVEQAPDHPHVFTQVTVHYVIEGVNVSETAVERAIELSFNRYCPASAMLEKAVKIEHSYEIKEA